MHILVASNAFKNSLTAEEACAAIIRGFNKSKLACTLESFPIGDGGDGTGSLIVKRKQGSIHYSRVHDPLGRNIDASFGIIDNGKTAIIEMAEASGLRLLKPGELSPLVASSEGTGELIIKALDAGVKKIIIGMGGSATVDGGIGILHALGIRFLDAQRKTLDPLPKNLQQLTNIDDSGIDHRIKDTELIVLCDVENLLLGEHGAAEVFGPQKGASPGDIKTLSAALQKLSAIVFEHNGKSMHTMKYGGTAGGAASGLSALANAQLVNGIDYYLDLNEFDKALEKCNIVITGEGSIDEQTLQGKGPFGIAARAKRKDIPVIAFAGKIPTGANAALNEYFDTLVSIVPGPCELHEALKNAAVNLERTGWQIANLLARNRQ